MHCGPSVTPAILDKVITSYRERGFGFVTVPQLLSGKVQATVFLPTPSRPAPAPPVTTPPRTVTLVSVSFKRTEYWPI